MRAFVYWNLNKRLFSVRNIKTGRVEDHAVCGVLLDAVFTVSQKGRERVLREKRKNVHAGVRGEWVDYSGLTPPNLRGFQRVTYNPYKNTSFVRARDGAPVLGAEFVVCVIKDGKERVYAKGLRLQKEVA